MYFNKSEMTHREEKGKGTERVEGEIKYRKKMGLKVL